MGGAEQQLEAAKALCVEGKYEEAAVELTEGLKKSPKNLDVLKQRALLYIKLQNAEDAELDVQEALRVQPDSVDFKVLQAHVYRIQGHFERGAELMTKVLEQQGVNMEVILERGHCFRLCMQYQRSLDDYTAAIEKDPKNACAYAGRGTTYWMGNIAACIADCESALAIEPTNGQALYTIGEAHRISGNAQVALGYFTIAIDNNEVNRMDPVDLYACRGLCLQLVGERNEEAIADLEVAFTGRPARQSQALWQFKANHFLGNAPYDAGMKEHYYTDDPM